MRCSFFVVCALIAVLCAGTVAAHRHVHKCLNDHVYRTEPVADLGLQWGKDGHSIVAMISEGLLDSGVLDKALAILGGGALSDYADWADTVKTQYPWSSPLHYIDVPDNNCTYIRSRDCFNEDGDVNMCVDGAIQNYTKQVTDASKTSDEQAMALKFVLHFVGDVHQPLHVGWTTDEGGNTISGTYTEQANSKVTLHELWDSYLIYTRIDDDFNRSDSEYATYIISQIQGPWKAQAAKWAACTTKTAYNACSDEWAVESIYDACHYAYVDQKGNLIKSGFNLGADYYNFTMSTMETQLAKAGVRLASVLTSIFV